MRLPHSLTASGSAGFAAAPHLPVPAQAVASRARLASIDLLRGLVMILMALDHTRDFFGASGFNPRDVAEPALFLTRWITHFCAPVFIFLAGVSAYLYGVREQGVGAVSRFLLTRGLWLMLIEFTIVRMGWSFSLDLNHFTTQVIWVIGASMVVLAGLVHLPRWAIAAVALAMIAGHNPLTGCAPSISARRALSGICCISQPSCASASRRGCLPSIRSCRGQA